MVNLKKMNTQFFDLFWEDIIVSHVLPYLSLNDCFNFRCVSKTCLQIIDIYFARLKSLELRIKGFSPHTFQVNKYMPSMHSDKALLLNYSIFICAKFYV